MTEDVSAGRLVAEVVSDTTGFARDAKKKVDAEVRAIKARIKAEIDTKGLATQAKAAAKEASKAAVVRLKVQLDTRGLIGQARAAAAAASAAATVRLKTEVDTRDVIAKVKAAAAEASTASATVGVDADTARADADVDAFRAKAKRTPVNVPVTADSKGLKQAATALTGMSKAPAIAGGIYTLGVAIVQLGGGLIAVASAGAQAIGVVGAIPNLIGVVAQGAGALLIGLNGVGDALGLMGKAETATTAATSAGSATAEATARAVESAARQRVRAAQNVKDAQQSLKDAETAAGEQSISGARAIADAQQALADARVAAADRSRAAIETVSDAEWSLARAQESSADAQKNLDDARVSAKKHIDDLNAALRTGAISEETAMLAVEKAKQHLQDVNWNAASSDLDKKEAQNAVSQAEDDAARIKSANQDVAKDAAKANKDGVEGSDQVKTARDQLRDALHAEQEDTENLANAQRELQRAGVESARAITDAQQGVADAVKANKDGQVAAARAIVQAQRGVVDAQQGYTDAVRAVADAGKDAAAGSSQAAKAQDLLAAAMAKLSPAGRKFAKFIFGLKPQWMGLRNAVQQALLPPIQEGITAALPLLGTLQDGLVDSATVAGGLGKSLGEALGEKSFNTDVGSIMASNNRAMQSFGGASLNVVQILRHLAVAAEPLVERFAAWTETLTGAWAEEVKAARETGKLEGWLNKAGDTAALLGDILGNVVGVLFNMGKAAAPAGLDLLKTLDKTTQKWQTFTQSDAGQAKMKEFFDATKPVTEELGKLVVNLLEFITKAGEGGGGSLNGFLTTLNFILGALNKVMAIPGAAPFIGWVLTLAGVGGALGLVAAGILRIGGNLGKLGKFTGFSKLIAGIRGSKEAIDDELPKDKAKEDALGGLDGQADKTGKTLGGKFVNGVKAASKAVVTGAKSLGGWIVNMAKMGAATALTTAKMVAQGIATVAMTIASNIAKAATAAWTAIQWLLNAAFFANPIGLIVLAVGLLVAAFIYAMKHSTKFRAVVMGALNGLKIAAFAVFNGLRIAIGAVIGFVIGFGTRLIQLLTLPFYIASALIDLAWKGIQAGFTAIVGFVQSGFAKAWALIQSLIIAPIEAAWHRIAYVLSVIQAVFNVVKDWALNKFSKAWAAVSGILSGPIDSAKRAIAGKIADIKAGFTTVKDWIINTWSKAWDKIKAKISGPIDSAKSTITSALGKDGIQKVFTDAVSAVGRIWDGLQNLAKKPIKFIIETVLNHGLIDGFNWIAGKVGAPPMDPIPMPKGFAGGGEFSGKIRGRASNKDNLVAKGPLGQRIGLATGEFIVKASETVKNLPLLRAINDGRVGSRVSQALQGGFADGGLFGKIKNAIGGAAQKGKEFGGDVLDVLKDPGAWFKKRMTGPLDRMKELGDSQFVNTIKAVPHKIVDEVVGKAKSILTGLGGSSGKGGGGPINPGLDGALNWVRTQVGKPYLWGGVGPDGYDCSGLMGALVNVIKGVEDPFTRLFATGSMPAGIFEKGRGAFSVGWFRGNPGHTAGTLNGVNVESRGGKGVVVGPNARGADDSLFNSGVYHLTGYAGGGRVGDPPFDSLDPRGKNRIPNVDELMKSLGVTFDTGGWVAPGSTAIHNGTGDHEAIFEPDAWRGASSVLDQITAIAKQILTTDSTPGAGNAPIVGTLQVTVGDKKDLPEALDEVTHRLRVIKRGGVYAGRPD